MNRLYSSDIEPLKKHRESSRVFHYGTHGTPVAWKVRIMYIGIAIKGTAHAYPTLQQFPTNTYFKYFLAVSARLYTFSTSVASLSAI